MIEPSPEEGTILNTSIAPMLSVRNGARAIEFYKAAFGASELYRFQDDSGAVVAQLAVGRATVGLRCLRLVPFRAFTARDGRNCLFRGLVE